MELDECSVNGDSGAEEDEDEEMSQGSATESSNNSSGSCTTTDSGEESADDQATTTSETASSGEEDDDENDAVEHPEERWETCIAAGTKLKLPQDLCEHESIFKEMLDYPKFWDECLTESQKESLYSFLPNFPKDCNIEGELEKTLEMLFSRELHRFGVNPLDDFHKHLSAGHFRPDIKRMRTIVKKAQKKKYLFQERKRAYELTESILKSRETLLTNAYKQGFSQSSHRPSKISKLPWKKPKPDIMEERTKLRYIQEINAINSEMGADAQLSDLDSDISDDNDDGSSSCLMTPAQASTGGKLKQQLQLLQQQQRRKKRAALVAQQQQMLPTRAMHLTCPGDEAIRPVYSTLQRSGTECSGVGVGMSFVTTRPDQSEDTYKAMLLAHKKRRARKDTHPELNTQGIALSDLMQRAQIGQKHKLSFTPRVTTSKKRIKLEQPQQPQLPPQQPQLSPQPQIIQVQPQQSLSQLQPQSQIQLQLQSQLQPQLQPQPQQQLLQQQHQQQLQQQQQQLQQQQQQQQQLQQQLHHQQQVQQQPLTSIKLSTTPVKMESDTNSYTSGDYSLHSSDDIRHLERPDNKPPEYLLADEEDIEDEPEDHLEHIEAIESIEHIEPMETIEEKYDIEPPAAQLPSTIMEEEHELLPVEMISPLPDIKEEIEELDFEPVEVKVDNSIVVSEEIQLALPISADIEEDLDKKDEIDLDSIDMMQLPIQLDDGIDILADVKCEDGNVITIPDKDLSDSLVEDIVMNGDELMQETHTCFFSLIRDAFLSKGEYRMNRTEMKDAVIIWQDNPISPLNDWYSLVPSWSALVPLALNFLAGELVYPQDHLLDGDQELVPYLENKGKGVYAWIGAGRDSDSRLSMLSTKFLLYKDLLVPPKPPALPSITTKQTQQQTQQQQITIVSTNSTDATDASALTDTILNLDGLPSSSPEWEPPKALCPTVWKVRPSTPEEREEFRRQERMRYAAPHKAFTYHMHGYTSVVGPVKGIYQHNAGSGVTKARGHSLLVSDRPNFVTILALVRDATARLPNGEGTRADICQLLKDSQYIQEDIFNNDKEANLNNVVSGALDRLHYEHDPCVRYYPKRKEWLYLHRARSESEFEMYHQQLQGIPKNKKSSGGSSRSKAQAANKANAKDSGATIIKEPSAKKEKKSSAQSNAARKEAAAKKQEEKLADAVSVDQSVSADQLIVVQSQSQQQLQQQQLQQQQHQLQQQQQQLQQQKQLQQQIQQQQQQQLQQQQQQLQQKISQQQQQSLPSLSQLSHPTVVAVTTTTATTTTPITITVPSSSAAPTLVSVVATTVSMTSTTQATTSSISAQAILNVTAATTTAASVPQMVTPVVARSVATVPEKENPMAVISTVVEPKPQLTLNAARVLSSPGTVKKVGTNVKPVAVVGATAAQSLLQSNQQHFPPQQIQVSTSAGVQTIGLSGHSVLRSSQTDAASNANVQTIFPTTAKIVQAQSQQQTVLTTQPGKSILQSNLKQQQQHPHVLPTKMLTSQMKLVNTSQIRSLLGSHQTILIKQMPSTSQSQTQTQQTQAQVQQRVVTSATTQQATQQQQQNAGVQRLIAQLGGKPIAVLQSSQQQQPSKVMAKVLTSSGGSQYIAVESLLNQKGLKLATTAAHANQLARQGNKVIQAQYQVVTQAQSATGQPKIIVSTQNQQTATSVTAAGQQQTVRMVTAQLAGKPIVLTSSGGKTVGVNVATAGNVVLGKQTAGASGQAGNQPIILNSQLLNIKTLHGLKVIPTSAGLKTGAAVYARVIAPSALNQANQASVANHQQSQQQQQQQTSQQQMQNNSPFGGTQ